MRIRLRDPDPDLYVTPHDHSLWGYGHELRVQVTIAFGTLLAADLDLESIADLSTGNGAIPSTIALATDMGRPPTLGDLGAGYPITGPIERTVHQLGEDGVDLFVCSETLEHVGDPDELLRDVRMRARFLLYSTPIHDDGYDENPEHVWQWATPDVHAMLHGAGWVPTEHAELQTAEYRYLIGTAE